MYNHIHWEPEKKQ